MLKTAIKIVVFHLLCIIIFCLAYSMLPINSFLPLHDNASVNKKNYSPDLLDLIYLTVTIQSGVGLSSITPVTSLTKCIVILQQLATICTTIIIVHIIIFEYL